MEKYPLSSMRKTLVEWKYQKKYSNELKSHDIHEKENGELDIIFKNRIKIINDGGSFDLQADPAKFVTSMSLLASFDEEEENERLKNFLSDFDNNVYIKACHAENNTTHKNNFFDK